MTILIVIEVLFTLIIVIYLFSLLWEAYERTHEEWELDQMDYPEYHESPTKENKDQ